MVRYYRPHIGQVSAVKFSLISATSIIALFSAGIGPVHAAALTAAPSQSNLYDLVHDGMTSADGGDGTVPLQDPSVTALQALESQIGGLRTAGFTGKADALIAAGNAYPAVPLNAAPGTRTVDDLVTPPVSAGQYEAQRKARAIGEERMAALIGTIGNGPAADTKNGGTVFVSSGNSAGFNDGGEPTGARSSSSNYAFAPSSSGTATITVAGAGNLSRPGNANELAVIEANSLRATPVAGPDATPALTMTDRAQPTLGYNYAPAISATVSPAVRTNSVAAVFSDVVTATGAQFADRVVPAAIQTSQVQTGDGKIQTSQVQTGPGRVQTSQVQTDNGKVQTSQVQPARSGRVQTSEAAAALSKLLDLSQPGPRGTNQADGTRTFLSASVSANPAATAALYMADAVNAAPGIAAARVSVEAFQIGPTQGAKTEASAATTVADPLHGKILASAGPLNSNLALP
jgi:hypothetical protein